MMNDNLSAKPVTVVLFDYETDRVTWHNEYGESEDSFAFTAAGKFHYCFGNGAGGYKTEEDKKLEKDRLAGHPVPDDMTNYDYDNHDGELRTIGFTLRVRPLEGTEAARMMDVKTEDTDRNAADIQRDRLVDLGNSLVDKMDLLLDHQEYIKNREATHRHMVEQTFTLVMKWTLLEALVLICVAAAQVSYLKKFFETKRYL